MIFTHKTNATLRQTWFSLYKRNVFTILITPKNRHCSLVPRNINIFTKKEENWAQGPPWNLKIIKKPLVFIAKVRYAMFTKITWFWGPELGASEGPLGDPFFILLGAECIIITDVSWLGPFWGVALIYRTTLLFLLLFKVPFSRNHEVNLIEITGVF